MVLCMDENGRIYQASRDSAKGDGVESIESSVSDFGVNLYQNPYTQAVNENVAQIRAIQAADEQEKMSGIRSKKAHAKAKANAYRRTENEMKKQSMNRGALAEEAILQGMGSADFDQLSIVDANYGKVHQAILQGMGRKPHMGESQYISNEVYQDPFEYEQYSLANDAYNKHGEQMIKNEEFYKAAQTLKTSTNSEGTVDNQAKNLLQALNEGELYFESEDEANAFNKLSVQEQTKYLKTHPDVYGAEESQKSISKTAMIVGAAALIYLLK